MGRLLMTGAVVLALSGSAVPASTHSDGTFRVSLYFLTDGGTAPLGVRRTVVRGDVTLVARLALEALLRGLTARERG